MSQDHKQNSYLNKPRKAQLDLQKMIAEADVTELRAFLRKESKRNKALSLKLKSKLLANYDLESGGDKYKALLSELISEGTDGTVTLTRRQTRLLNEICLELLELAHKYHIRNEHRENHTLLNAMTLYLHRFIDKQESPPDYLQDRLSETYTAILSLLQFEIAPELRDDIIRAGQETMSRSYHILHHDLLNMPAVLLSAIHDDEQLSDISQILVDKVGNSKQHILWAVWYAIYRAEQDRLVDRDIVLRSMTSRDIYQAARFLKENGFTGAFFNWLISFEEHITLDRVRLGHWHLWHLERSTELGDGQRTLRYAYTRFIETADPNYLDILASLQDVDSTINQLKADGQFNLVAEILATDQRWDTLSQFIKETNNWKLMLTHLDGIARNADSAFQQLWPVVQSFVEQHAGNTCVSGLESMFEILIETNNSDLLNSMQSALEETNPGRFDSLMRGLKISY